MRESLNQDGPLARLREKARLTQAAAAARLGMSVWHLRTLELGRCDTKTATAKSMAKLYGVDVSVVVDAIEKSRAAYARRASAA